MLKEKEVRSFCDVEDFIKSKPLTTYQIRNILQRASKLETTFGNFMVEVRMSNFNVSSVEELMDLYTAYHTGFSNIKS